MTSSRIIPSRVPSSSDYYRFIQSLLPERRIKPNFYSERHHIVPVCIFGDDSPENLIYLKPSEHLIAHQLLVDAFPEEGKLKSALWFMTHLQEGELDPEGYEELRILCRNALSTRRKGDCSQETKDKISRIHKGKKISDEHKKANSEAISNYLLNTPEGQSQAKRGGETSGKLPWWTKDGKNKRSLECPGEGWVRGRAKSISEAMSKAGSKNKGKLYWHRALEDGTIIRRRSAESPGIEWSRGYKPG